ncbi:MAG: hypothetical protein Q9203_000082 [Teloschistes exilis]
MASKQGKMQNLKINYRMRITLTDGRQMTGQMLAFDKHMNLVLADTEEFRRVKRKPTKGAQSAPGSTAPAMVESEEKRTLGLTIVRGTHIVSCSVDGPPPADPSARLGTSAPGGAAGAPPTLVAGPGISRPAGRGLPVGLSGPAAGVGGPAPPGGFPGFPPAGFPGGAPPGFAGRGGPPGGGPRRLPYALHKDSNLLQGFKDLRVAEDFLQDFKAGDEQTTKGCRKTKSTKADTANSFFAEALEIIILKAIVKGTRVTRLLRRNCQTHLAMAAALSALNAKIRSQPVLNYVCSTHFWGPVSNFGIPVAAIADMQKDPEMISGRMTAALTIYSATFMRYSMAVTPKNYLLLACHTINLASQSTQGIRFLKYWNYGGREEALKLQAQQGAQTIQKEGKNILQQGEEKLKEVKDKVVR